MEDLYSSNMETRNMGNVQEAVATFERNIESSTGKSIQAWVKLVAAQNLLKHGEMVSWLKSENGLSHSHANHIAKRTMEAALPVSEDDPGAHLFANGKEGVRPLYDRLVTLALGLGSDVEVAIKKANSSVRRRKQFALIQPSTRTRVDLGLILPGVHPEGRLEASGSFNAMFTHRIKLAMESDIDAEVKRWLRAAYLAAK